MQGNLGAALKSSAPRAISMPWTNPKVLGDFTGALRELDPRMSFSSSTVSFTPRRTSRTKSCAMLGRVSLLITFPSGPIVAARKVTRFAVPPSNTSSLKNQSKYPPTPMSPGAPLFLQGRKSVSSLLSGPVGLNNVYSRICLPYTGLTRMP